MRDEQDDIRRYMPLVERLSEAGAVSRSDYATMLDRMLMRGGLRQRYGTQTVQRVDLQNGEQPLGACYVWPVEDASGLDSLRVSVGLPPMSEYVKLVEQTYEVEVTWNPALGIEDMPVRYPQSEKLRTRLPLLPALSDFYE